jgi:hypothetical protein
MAIDDESCTIMIYFKVLGGDLNNFKKLCGYWIEETNKEPDCLYCSFSVNGNIVNCRENYKNANAILAHLDNIGDLLFEALTITQISRLEIHGPENQLAKLQQPLANMNPQFFSSLPFIEDNKKQPQKIAPISISA